jgi:hypothetical protein
MDIMKTTLEIPDPIFRKAKARAAELGIPLRAYVSQAVEEKLTAPDKYVNKPWMKFAGALADLHEENVRIAKIIEDEFEQIEPEDIAWFWTPTRLLPSSTATRK